MARETRSFTARLAKDTLDTLQQIANEDDRSLAYVVQKAIDAYAGEHSRPRKVKKAKPAQQPDAPQAETKPDAF